MINVSDECKEVMAERRDFRLFARAALADGTELELDGEDFTLTGNSLTDGAGSSGLPLGAAVCRQVCLQIANDDGHLDGTDFFGARFRVWLTLALSETEEQIELGTFTAVEPAALGGTVTVTAWDDMYRADRDYETDLSFPATLGSMFRDICQRCGIGYDTAAFPNDGYLVGEKPSGEHTFRQVLGYIAMLAGGNARVDRTGRMRIIPYDLAAEPALELAEWGSLELSTDDVTVTGLSMAVDGGDGTERTVLYGEEGYVLAVENPLAPAGGEQAALALMGAGLIGHPMRPFQGDHAALPMAEFMDTVLVRDRKGRTYKSVLTDVDLAVGGYTSLANSAEPAVRNGSRYVTPEARALQTARKLVDGERTARQTAVEQLARTLAESGGLYSTAQVQQDESVVYYLHDKPTLEASRSVMKLTSQAIGFSTDGGKTWPFGFSVTGEMVMGIIRAEGLNADWVKFGTFEQARVEGLPELASNMEVMAERITAAVEGVQTLSGEAITGAASEFYLSDSPTALAGGSWSAAQPAWEPGKYIWSRQRVTRGDGKVVYTPSESGVCITGNTGAKGDKGETGAQGPAGADGAPGEKGDKGDTGPQGPAGEDGAPGKDGAPGEKGDTGPAGPKGDTGAVGPAGPKGDTGATGAQGPKGDTGATGAAGPQGKAGNGINSITYYYAVTAAQTPPAASAVTSTTMPTLSAENKYLWQKEVIDFTDPSVADKTTVILLAVYGNTGATGAKGDKGDPGAKGDTGAAGTSVTITSTSVTYQASNSGTTAPTGTWGGTVPSVSNGQYLWTKTVVNYSNGTSTTAYSVAYKGTNGAKGDKGDTGAQGPTGPAGPKGDTGAVGPAGPKGDTGATGAQGPKGDTGPKGATGAQGPKGDTGAAGAQGPKGDTGAAGAKGDL